MIRAAYFAVLIVAIALAAWNGFVQQANLQFGDILLSRREPAVSGAVRKIVLLAIDDRTVAGFGPLPLNRGILAAGLERLAESPPDVLAVDLLLAEATPSDGRLARALGRFPRVVMAAALESDAVPEARWIWPLPVFPQGSVGHVHAEPDPDGVVRSILLEKRGAGRTVWAFGAQIAGQPLRASPVPMRINFAGPEGAFRRISFAALLEGRVAPETLRGKIAILGVTAQGAGDRYFTPLSTQGLPMSGIEIHANIVRTLLDRAFLVPLDVGGECVAYALIAAACLAAVGYLRGLRLFLALALLAAALPLACLAALRFDRVWPPASFLAVFLVSVALGGAGQYGALAAALRRADRQRKEYAFRVQAIAHEIKTPLTAIQGSSEMITDESVPEAARAEMAGLIHKESKRLTSLIETFLDVERISAGALAIEKRPVDLAALCAEVVERARLYAARKKSQIHANLCPCTLEADPDLLSFAVYNLLTNAVKYSPRESSILLETHAGAGMVSVTVSDQGYGIAAGEQQRIFERFYRLKRDRSSGEPGSGIGLALVKEIVTQHGGRVEVESKPGAGSRFTLVFWKSRPSS
jgi:signal transduction histidine kinase